MTQDTDREIMQQALEALEASIALTMTKIELRNEAIAALREVLAEQPVQEPYCYVYASRLAKHLWKKHYMKDAPQWKPFDDLIGVLTQIDNMTTGLTRLARQEPVAHSIVAGALFDFMGWLTTRRERLVLSSVDNASPAADAIKDFAEMRGLSISDAEVQRWQEHLAAPQPEQEPVAWRNAALRVGEDLCSVGPFGYYDMTAQQWLNWALSVVTCHPAPQPRQWPQLMRGVRVEGDNVIISAKGGNENARILCGELLKEKANEQAV